MIKKISLAQKVMLFFLVPAVAQVVLLLGVVIIQVETANYYPHRAAQDREITDAHTDSLLADFLLLKDIKKLLDARAAPSATDREDLRALTST